MSSSGKCSYSPNPLRFSPIPVAVLKNDQIPHGAMALLGLILDYARSDPSTYVSVERLARDINRRRRTVQLWLGYLRSHGWIRFEDDESVPTGRRIVLAWRGRGGDGEVGPQPSATPDETGPGPRTGGRNPLRLQWIAPDPDAAERGRNRPTTTEAAAPSTGRPRPPDVVVPDRRDEKPEDKGRENPAVSPEIVEALVGLGVTRSVAEGLAGDFDPERICRQIEALPHRKPVDRAAALVKSIREDWAMPEGLRRLEEAAARLAEEERARRDAEARKRLEQLHERTVAEFWDALTPEVKERFLGEAIEHAEPEVRDHIRKMNPRHPLYRAHRAAVRDHHIRRVLGLPPLESR